MNRYSLETREKAAELIGRGCGKTSLASALAIPASIAEEWVRSYRAVGEEAFLDMGPKHRHYDYETKLAAARDFVDLGMTRQEVMSKHGIVSESQLKKWAKGYREGGPKTREQELEDENRRLRAEVAYLKKLRALEASRRAPGRSAG